MSTPLEEFLDWALLNLGEKRVVRLVEASLKRRATPMSVDSFLDRMGTRNQYRAALKLEDKKIVNKKALAHVLLRSGVSLSLNLACPPWDEWTPGSTVYIVAGVRKVSIPEVSRQLLQRAVGGRDAESMMLLTGIFQSHLQIEAEVRPVFIPSDLSYPDAEKTLAQIIEKPGVGAIGVIGSSLVNPVAEILARRILKDSQADVKFQFGCKSRKDSVLNAVKECQPEEEGISYNGKLHPRIRDDQIAMQFRDNAKATKSKYSDAGLLLVDCRTKPFLIGCLGHGGCGTYACCEALNKYEEISNRLRVGDNRIIEVINVARKKPPKSPLEVDDLLVDDWSWATEI